MMKEATLLQTNIKLVVKEIKVFQATADKTLDGIKQVQWLAALSRCTAPAELPLDAHAPAASLHPLCFSRNSRPQTPRGLQHKCPQVSSPRKSFLDLPLC